MGCVPYSIAGVHFLERPDGMDGQKRCDRFVWCRNAVSLLQLTLFPFLFVLCSPGRLMSFTYRHRAVVASVLRLCDNVESFNPTPTTTMSHTWYTGITWAMVEHGLSLFAASILALKPVVHLVSRSLSSLSSSLNSNSRKKASGKDASGGLLKNSDWTASPEGTELGNIGIQTKITANAKYRG